MIKIEIKLSKKDAKDLLQCIDGAWCEGLGSCRDELIKEIIIIAGEKIEDYTYLFNKK